MRHIGGTFEVTDVPGAGDGMYDVRITLEGDRTVALEVTSYGGRMEEHGKPHPQAV